MRKFTVLISVILMFICFSCEKDKEDNDAEKKTPSFVGTWMRTEQVDFGAGPVTMTHTIVLTDSSMTYTAQNPDETRTNEYRIDSYNVDLKHILSTVIVTCCEEYYPVGTVNYTTYNIDDNKLTMVGASDHYPASGTSADTDLDEMLDGPYTKQ